MRLKENLRHLLSVYGWSQSELSRRCGVKQQVLSLWFSGSQPRSLDDLKKVAECLKIYSIDELLFSDLTKRVKQDRHPDKIALDSLLPADGSFHRVRLEILVRRLKDDE